MTFKIKEEKHMVKDHRSFVVVVGCRSVRLIIYIIIHHQERTWPNHVSYIILYILRFTEEYAITSDVLEDESCY